MFRLRHVVGLHFELNRLKLTQQVLPQKLSLDGDEVALLLLEVGLEHGANGHFDVNEVALHSFLTGGDRLEVAK